MTRQVPTIRRRGLRGAAQGHPLRSGLPRFCLTALAALPVPPANAETLVWTGAAGSASWSDLANWDLGRAPLDGDGVIRLMLGADTAGSDQLFVDTLLRGGGSTFLFDLLDDGVSGGTRYELIHFNSVFGFADSDFSSSGMAGTFSLANGALAFTTSAVPEPGMAWLLTAGLLILAGLANHRNGRSAESRPGGLGAPGLAASHSTD